MDSYFMDAFNEHIAMHTVPELPWEATTTTIGTGPIPPSQPQVPNQVVEGLAASETANQIDEHLFRRRQHLAHIVHQLKQLQQLHKMLKHTNKRLRQEISLAEWSEKLHFDNNVDQSRPQPTTGQPEYTARLDIPIPIPPQELVSLPEIRTTDGALQPSIDQSLHKLQIIETRIEMLRTPWIKLRESAIQLRTEFNDLEKRMQQIRAYKKYINQHPWAFTLLPGPVPPQQQPSGLPPQAIDGRQNDAAVAPSSILVPSAQQANPECIDLTLDNNGDDDDVQIIDPPPGASSKTPIPEWRKRMAHKTMTWYNKTSAAPTQIKELGGPLFNTLNREARMERPSCKDNLRYDQIKTSWEPTGLLASISSADNETPKVKKRAREPSPQQHQEDVRVRKRARTRKTPPKIPLSKEQEPEPEQSPLEPAVYTNDDLEKYAAEMAALLEGEPSDIAPAAADFEHQSNALPNTVDPKELETSGRPPPTSVSPPISTVEETIRPFGDPDLLEDFDSGDFSTEGFDLDSFEVPGSDKIAEELDRELFGESP
ncbi:hypothetical protein DV737_g505, partial [Chaetothyriales sp. CBS 132003]